jgi:hypothetical protein
VKTEPAYNVAKSFMEKVSECSKRNEKPEKFRDVAKQINNLVSDLSLKSSAMAPRRSA